jgi:hypothetical protein
MHGMANRCEPLINVVIDHKPKVLTGLTNRYVAGSGVPNSPDADTPTPSAERRSLPHA